MIVKRFLNVEELAEYLGFAVGTLYVWVCRKKIPYLKIGRTVKFDLQEIENWLKDKRIRELS
ncbi:MAG: helix-turn-helix domain-containing protein [Candidatus Omnitrophica bacterium]|nr:helix-turn-helix domain-containing protein [Candidatus Omnitrophota bacterium]